MAITLAVLLATAFVSACAAPQMDTTNFNQNSNNGIMIGIDRAFMDINGGILTNLDGPVAGRPRCPRGEMFHTCASGCTLTCSNYRMQTQCTKDCRPGCFCPDGLIRDERQKAKCVRPFNCRRHGHHGHKHSHEDSDEYSESSSSESSSEEHHHKKGSKDKKHKKDKKESKD